MNLKEPQLPIQNQNFLLEQSTQQNNINQIKIQQQLSIVNKNNQKQQQIDEILEENKMLKEKLKYIDELLIEGLHFEKTNDMIKLKQFIEENYEQFSQLLQELYEQKIANQKFLGQINELQSLVVQLQSEMKSMQQLNQIQQNSSKLIQIAATSINKKNNNDEIMQLQQKIRQVNEEISNLTLENENLKDKIQKKDFFREYDMMLKEVAGLRKQNQQLMEIIQKFQISQNTQQKENQKTEYPIYQKKFQQKLEEIPKQTQNQNS